MMICPLTNEKAVLRTCIKTCPQGPCDFLKKQTVVIAVRDFMKTGMSTQEVKEELTAILTEDGKSDLINYIDIAIQEVGRELNGQ